MASRQFQSTPPCGGRRFMPPLITRWKNVSIHAPVRGATGVLAVDVLQANGFNPRPRAGGDATAGSRIGFAGRFQSTPPCGGRLVISSLLHQTTSVSIHAPVRGATLCSRRASPRFRRFNPRPRAGGDRNRQEHTLKCSSFNPRPRAGGDGRFLSCFHPGSCFNPRPRAGGDPGPCDFIISLPRFQSTPPCGGRPSAQLTSSHLSAFQSTPPCGGRRVFSLSMSCKLTVSIHAPVRGATGSARRFP